MCFGARLTVPDDCRSERLSELAPTRGARWSGGGCVMVEEGSGCADFADGTVRKRLEAGGVVRAPRRTRRPGAFPSTIRSHRPHAARTRVAARRRWGSSEPRRVRMSAEIQTVSCRPSVQVTPWSTSTTPLRARNVPISEISNGIVSAIGRSRHAPDDLSMGGAALAAPPGPVATRTATAAPADLHPQPRSERPAARASTSSAVLLLSRHVSTSRVRQFGITRWTRTRVN